VGLLSQPALGVSSVLPFDKMEDLKGRLTILVLREVLLLKESLL